MQATQIVHWPGQDSPMCDKHAEKAKLVAQAMGFQISSTPLIIAVLGGAEVSDEHLICKNCENEEKK